MKLLLAAALAVTGLMPAAWAHSFSIVNDTKMPIIGVYFGQPDTDQWTVADGIGWVVPGKDGIFTFNDTDDCDREVRIEFSTGISDDLPGGNLCTVRRIVVQYEQQQVRLTMYR